MLCWSFSQSLHRIGPSAKFPGNASTLTAVSGSVSQVGCQDSLLILILLLLLISFPSSPDSTFGWLWESPHVLSSILPFFAILSHHLLLYSFLIIISNSLLPLLPFSSEIFRDLEEKYPHFLLVDSPFCIHLSQSLNTDLKSQS